MILLLVYAVFIDEHFYGVFDKEFLHRKNLDVDLKLDFQVIFVYFIQNNL